jgi:hypothetical protein
MENVSALGMDPIFGIFSIGPNIFSISEIAGAA